MTSWCMGMLFRAHPRVRGDVVDAAAGGVACEGSPPRARGRPPRCRWQRSTQRAHPRVRGDVPAEWSSKSPSSGSPPRARGRPLVAVDVECLIGLTPACAGTSLRRPSWYTAGRAHPRVRGDVYVGDGQPTRKGGSPPRARGRRRCPPRRGAQHRAHPRVRGDVPVTTFRKVSLLGSPPRARGRPGVAAAGADGAGLTPACAGTSAPGCWSSLPGWAHPRVRGDVKPAVFAAWVFRGSPPRARGRLRQPPSGLAMNGLTPACAGTSRRHRRCGMCSGAHPRVRGDVGPRIP